MKAIVCGAGIAGLTVAGELARAGWHVTVLESSPKRREQGYMIDFFGPGFAAAQAMGLLPRLRELAYDIDQVSFVDDRGRARTIGYEIFAASQDGELMSIMRPDLELALLESLPGNVTVRFGSEVTGFTQRDDGVDVVVADESTESCDILVGADGIHSRIRRELFGDENQFLRQLGFHTCAYIFDDRELYEDIGKQWLLTDTLHRMMGLYALRGGRVAAFGTHRVDDPALPADTRAAAREAYAGIGPLTDRALDRCPEPAELYYDQVAQVELPNWSSGRVVLVGDACQAVSLLAGQGASLAVAGGRLLASELLSASTPADAFANYESRWRPVVEDKQAAGRRAAASFVPTTRLAIVLRRIALRVLNWPLVGKLVTSRIIGGKQAASASD